MRVMHGLRLQGSYKKLQPFLRTFQGPPTTNTISQTVQKCTFPVYSNKALRRGSMGLTDRRKTAKNLVDSRKNWKILTVSRK